MSFTKPSTKSGCAFKQAMVNETPAYDRKPKRRRKRKGKNALYE